jgi:hypothetical protein
LLSSSLNTGILVFVATMCDADQSNTDLQAMQLICHEVSVLYQ